MRKLQAVASLVALLNMGAIAEPVTEPVVLPSNSIELTDTQKPLIDKFYFLRESNLPTHLTFNSNTNEVDLTNLSNPLILNKYPEILSSQLSMRGNVSFEIPSGFSVADDFQSISTTDGRLTYDFGDRDLIFEGIPVIESFRSIDDQLNIYERQLDQISEIFSNNDSPGTLDTIFNDELILAAKDVWDSAQTQYGSFENFNSEDWKNLFNTSELSALNDIRDGLEGNLNPFFSDLENLFTSFKDQYSDISFGDLRSQLNPLEQDLTSFLDSILNQYSGALPADGLNPLLSDLDTLFGSLQGRYENPDFNSLTSASSDLTTFLESVLDQYSGVIISPSDLDLNPLISDLESLLGNIQTQYPSRTELSDQLNPLVSDFNSLMNTVLIPYMNDAIEIYDNYDPLTSLNSDGLINDELYNSINRFIDISKGQSFSTLLDEDPLLIPISATGMTTQDVLTMIEFSQAYASINGEGGQDLSASASANVDLLSLVKFRLDDGELLQYYFGNGLSTKVAGQASFGVDHTELQTPISDSFIAKNNLESYLDGIPGLEVPDGSSFDLNLDASASYDYFLDITNTDFHYFSLGECFFGALDSSQSIERQSELINLTGAINFQDFDFYSNVRNISVEENIELQSDTIFLGRTIPISRGNLFGIVGANSHYVSRDASISFSKDDLAGNSELNIDQTFNSFEEDSTYSLIGAAGFTYHPLKPLAIHANISDTDQSFGTSVSTRFVNCLLDDNHFEGALTLWGNKNNPYSKFYSDRNMLSVNPVGAQISPKVHENFLSSLHAVLLNYSQNDSQERVGGIIAFPGFYISAGVILEEHGQGFYVDSMLKKLKLSLSHLEFDTGDSYGQKDSVSLEYLANDKYVGISLDDPLGENISGYLQGGFYF